MRIERRAFRLLLLGVGSAAIAFAIGAAPAQADNGPHMMGAGVVADGCASCHRTHTAKAGKLLKQAQPALCYSCHGTTGAGASTDVQAGTGYAAANPRGAAAGALRGGGFITARIDSIAPSGQKALFSNSTGLVPVLGTGTATTSAHSVDGTSQIAWGNGATGTAGAGAAVSLTCGSCHDPHGNGNYRVLKALPDQSGALAVATNIVEPAATLKTYTTANYWKSDDANTAGFIANVSAWCTTCHTRYLSIDGAATNADAIFNYKHKSNGTTLGSANCITCHVSHGSNASMSALATAAGNPDGTVSTSSRLLRIDNKGTCQMCHNR